MFQQLEPIKDCAVRNAVDIYANAMETAILALLPKDKETALAFLTAHKETQVSMVKNDLGSEFADMAEEARAQQLAVLMLESTFTTLEKSVREAGTFPADL